MGIRFLLLQFIILTQSAIPISENPFEALVELNKAESQASGAQKLEIRKQKIGILRLLGKDSEALYLSQDIDFSTEKWICGQDEKGSLCKKMKAQKLPR